MKTLFKGIVGSHAYGLNIKTSDTDFKSVYQCANDDILGFTYKEQIEYSKDSVGYEAKRFLELLRSANPTVLELMYSPEDCILEKDPIFNLILENRDKFLTKKCLDSFGGYAYAQIRKARGLSKKMNYEKEQTERREPIDFCVVIEEGKTIPLRKYMEPISPKHDPLLNNQIGLVNLDHAPDCYAMYIAWSREAYNGVFAKNSDTIITSSVAKGEKDVGTLVYNRNAYRMHLKDWESYQTWLTERNTSRYIESQKHGQLIDGKNLMHCRRLLNMALEIPVEKTLNVRRKDRENLLTIRRGECNLSTLIEEAENDLKKLDDLYANCDLPDSVDFEFLNDLLLQIRKSY